ncbi:hypothetical protein [Nitrosopumilus sp.]|uniref:hypothetical protein n=1 Tax=Nitrosopumilus sp. TaxID=2024843 RepID=UPI003B5C6CEE
MTITLPTRQHPKSLAKRKVFGIASSIIFLSFVFLYNVYPGSSYPEPIGLQSALIITAMVGFLPVSLLYLLLLERNCKICGKKAALRSKYCILCGPIITQILYNHKGNIICNKCKQRSSNYDNFLTHFQKLHGGSYSSPDAMSSQYSFVRKCPYDNAIREIS